MKKIFLLCWSIGLVSCVNVAFAQDQTTRIKIQVTDAEGRLIEKEFDSTEAMQADPELKELGITMEQTDGRTSVHSRSKGDSRRVMVYQHSDGNGGNSFYHYQTEDTDIFSADSTRTAFRERFGADSAEREHFEKMRMSFEERRKERDSLRAERHAHAYARHDSLRAEHRAEMEKRREEMRQRMEEMRERRRDMDTDFSTGEGNRVVIIQSLSREEAEKLGIKDQSLQLEKFKLYPNPGKAQIKLEFEAAESGPVQIKLTDGSGSRVLFNETRDIAAGFYQETIEVGEQDNDTFILQLIKDDKGLSRRIIMR